ncbi:MAG: hypothetical protein ABI673_08575 [Novosphingobium sp.]
MSGFLFAFLCAVLAGIGARDQVLVAQLSARLGPHPGLLVVALCTGGAASAGAAFAASAMSAQMATAMGGPARLVFAALALAIAGAEALLSRPRKPADEPTRSLVAAAVVLLAGQLTDAVRLVVLALALLTAAPIPVGMGGAAASAALLGTAWAFPALATNHRTALARRIAGGILLIAALVLALRVFG